MQKVIVLCDIHHGRGKEVLATRVRTVLIDGKGVTLDLDEECDLALHHALEEFFEQGRSAAAESRVKSRKSPPKSALGRTGKFDAEGVAEFLCTVADCPRGVTGYGLSSHRGRSRHMSMAHPGVPQPEIAEVS